jgi:chemotaxis protein methyltransferase CheR
VYHHSGIRLTAAKTALVHGRLQRRLAACGVRTFDAYVDFVRRDPYGPEALAMVDALTTNQTSFFREREHFRFLRDRFVPDVLARGAVSISAWSAGCATGEEPYSIAITLLDTLRGRGSCRIAVTASDISETALNAAVRGVYPMDRVRTVPWEMLRRYFERGVESEDGLGRVRIAVRRFVRFEHASLLDGPGSPRAFDFIFCRNTLMYFDPAARQRAIQRFEAALAPGGYLFVSHAENLSGIQHRLERMAPAIYRQGLR